MDDLVMSYHAEVMMTALMQPLFLAAAAPECTS